MATSAADTADPVPSQIGNIGWIRLQEISAVTDEPFDGFGGWDTVFGSFGNVIYDKIESPVG